jgi:hypothetical protein
MALLVAETIIGRRRRRDQQQNGDTAECERAGNGADLLLPAPVIVEGDALEFTAKSGRDFLKVRRLHAIDFNRNEARHGQRLQGIGIAEPGFQQRGRGFQRQRLCRPDARLPFKEGHDVEHRLVGIDLVTWLDLHGHLTGDVAQPGVGRLLDHPHRARGQTGEEAHDGDDERQRPAGDGSRRHDRCRHLHLAAGILFARRCVHVARGVIE